jgi:hypothetical protein
MVVSAEDCLYLKRTHATPKEWRYTQLANGAFAYGEGEESPSDKKLAEEEDDGAG